MSIVIGVLAMIFFLVGDGARALYAAFFLFNQHQLDPYLVAFVAALFSLLLTVVMACFKSKQQAQAPPKPRDKGSSASLLWNYILLNLFTILNSVAGYLSICYILPAVSSMLAVGVGPMLYNLVHLNKSSTSEKWLSCLLFAGSVLVLLSDTTAFALRKGSLNILVGFALSVLCGIAVLCNTLLCKRLSKAGEPPMRVQAGRSILVLVVTFCLCIRNPMCAVSPLSLCHLVIFAFVFVLLPQLCLQLAIKHLHVGLIHIWIAAAPIFSAVVQVLFFQVPVRCALALLLLVHALVITALSAIQLWQQRQPK